MLLTCMEFIVEKVTVPVKFDEEEFNKMFVDKPDMYEPTLYSILQEILREFPNADEIDLNGTTYSRAQIEAYRGKSNDSV